MKIININGPINSGKSTVSRILVKLLSKAVFIEVDELLTDDEQSALGLDFKAGIAERLKRLDVEVKKYIASKQYDYIIFAYPLTAKNYSLWKNMIGIILLFVLLFRQVWKIVYKTVEPENSQLLK